MSNPNYLKGVRKERRIVNEERAKGNIALRSAGSHSPIDVVSIDKRNGVIKLIQCKPDDFPISQTEKLLKEQEALQNQWFLVVFQII